MIKYSLFKNRRHLFIFFRGWSTCPLAYMRLYDCLHIFYRSSTLTVVLSEHNLDKEEGYEQVFNVSKIFVHNYNYRSFNNDIMLLKVSFSLSKRRQRERNF